MIILIKTSLNTNHLLLSDMSKYIITYIKKYLQSLDKSDSKTFLLCQVTNAIFEYRSMCDSSNLTKLNAGTSYVHHFKATMKILA